MFCSLTSTVVTARPCIATTGVIQALALKKEENFKSKLVTGAYYLTVHPGLTYL